LTDVPNVHTHQRDVRPRSGKDPTPGKEIRKWADGEGKSCDQDFTLESNWTVERLENERNGRNGRSVKYGCPSCMAPACLAWYPFPGMKGGNYVLDAVGGVRIGRAK
jgi:hypothetical protein